MDACKTSITAKLKLKEITVLTRKFLDQGGQSNENIKSPACSALQKDTANSLAYNLENQKQNCPFNKALVRHL